LQGQAVLELARRSPHAAKQPLTDAEIESRRTELQQLAPSSLAWRAFTYFMGCFACQACWTALAIHALTRGLCDPMACVLSASAMSGAAVLVQSAPLPRALTSTKSTSKGHCGCGK
jgi:apolipoprotein N-acyltransferase